MTNLKGNDFKEGMLDPDDSMKVTFRNLDTKSYVNFDGDPESVLKLQADILDQYKPYFEKWVKPNKDSDLKFGRFEPYEPGWFAVTIKDQMKGTYLHLWNTKSVILDLIRKYGLKPKWLQRKDGNEIKVSE